MPTPLSLVLGLGDFSRQNAALNLVLYAANLADKTAHHPFSNT